LVDEMMIEVYDPDLCVRVFDVWGRFLESETAPLLPR
jgi:hypothetical protein